MFPRRWFETLSPGLDTSFGVDEGGNIDADPPFSRMPSDGGGPALYAGGHFFATAGGVSANYIAKWDGSVWSALGTGMNGGVEALAVFDDGNGPALYAGGWFTTAGGKVSARGDGSGRASDSPIRFLATEPDDNRFEGTAHNWRDVKM